MPSRKRSVEIEVVLDDKTATRSLKNIDTHVTKTGQAFSQLGTAVKAAGLALGARELGQFVWNAAQMAASAEQAGEAAEKVLGPALDGLHDRLEGVRGVMGLNKGELDDLIARFGLLTEGFGLTDDAQADFIEMMITTGGELASFRGQVEQTPEAIDALGAAIRGEFDPLEQWGVKLKQSEVNERALEIQARDTTGSISDQEAQIAAIEELIREKAAPAFGSLAEAQDTLGGKVNDATVRWEDFQIELGERVLPGLIEAGDQLLDIIDILGNDMPADGFVSQTIVGFEDLVGALKTAWGWLSTIEGTLRDIPDFGSGTKFDDDSRRGQGDSGRFGGGGVRTPSGGGSIGTSGPFHTGGVVPGLPGSDQLVWAQAGETIGRRAAAHMGGSTVINHVSITNPSSVLLRELMEMNRRGMR